MGLLLLLLAQDAVTIPKAEKHPYLAAREKYIKAREALEKDPAAAERLLTEILSDSKVRRTECRIRIEQGTAYYTPWLDFFPLRLRAQARSAQARVGDKTKAMRLLEGAVQDLELSLKRAHLKETRAELERARRALRKLRDGKAAESPSRDDGWEAAKAELRFHARWRAKSSAVERFRKAIESVSPDTVLAWLRDELDRLPSKPGPREGWLQRRAEAAAVVAWCTVVEKSLSGRGGTWTSILTQVKTRRGAFERVAKYRGSISLVLYILPYARLKSLAVDGREVVRDSRVVPQEPLTVSNRDLYTPLVLRGVEIGELRLALSHPGLGEREVKLSGADWRDGASVQCAGGFRGTVRVTLLR